jgi:DNA-binding transcriptional LysR family regulator
VALAETNNFQEAANNLFISQSSLSKHISAIEKELGVQLFDRSTRNVKLSKYGRLLLPYAYKVVQLEREYTNDINCEIKKNMDRITIASTSQMFQYSITEILTQYKRQHISTSFNMITYFKYFRNKKI